VRFILRVWLPDRPGALGRVASAIGSVGASLVAIDILEQGGGSAIDELVVEAVDSPNAAEKLTVALQFVEGVSVESIHPTHGAGADARVDALETAAELVSQNDREELVAVLVRRVVHDVMADWAVVLQSEDDAVLHAAGEPPNVAWLRAFVEGAKSLAQHGGDFAGPDDVAWAGLEASGLVLLLGRSGRPFRARERLQLVALARIADHRYAAMG
jgi:hypothetical protein